MATMTTARRLGPACSPCPACGSARLRDADGKPTCTTCPLPFRPDRAGEYRRAKGSAVAAFGRIEATVAKLREQVEAFDGSLVTAGSPLVEFLGDTADTVRLARGLLAALASVELQVELLAGELPR